MNESALWRQHDAPFPYITASNVLSAGAYAGVAEAFRRLLDGGLHEGRRGEGFLRAPWAKRAYANVLTEGAPGFEVFLSRSWHDAIAARFGIATTGEVSIALHHHLPGNANGTPHTDLSPAWFPDRPAAGDPDRAPIVVHDPSVSSYPTGRAYRPGVTTHRSVRAIAVLFYLENTGWRPGDGGETGLFACGARTAEAPAVRVPPIDNTLLAFECTPRSLHCFLANEKPRSSLVMWLHRQPEDVAARWGESAIVAWHQRPLRPEVLGCPPPATSPRADPVTSPSEGAGIRAAVNRAPAR